MLKTRVFTLYPDLFPGPFGTGIYKKALQKKIWSLDVVNIRDSAKDKNKTVDDTPFGGGSGMLIKPDVLAASMDSKILDDHEHTIYLSPKGIKFDQSYAKKMTEKKIINIVCGHFEGIDNRVLENKKIEEVCIGDYVTSGGEVAAYIFIDVIVRLLPGVLGNHNSIKEESFENHLLEYPQYTKPQKWDGKEVPKVLLSGNHAEIKSWRLSQAEDITRRRRPDMWRKYKKND